MYAVVYYALGWVVVPEDSGQLVFSRIECRGGPEVQISRTLTVDTDLMWHVMAHGRELLVGMEVVSELPEHPSHTSSRLRMIHCSAELTKAGLSANSETVNTSV